MKKGILILVGLVILSLVIAGCEQAATENKENVNENDANNADTADSGAETPSGQQNENQAASANEWTGKLSEAMKLGSGLSCNVAAAGVTKILVKGNNFKMSISEQGVTQDTITKDEGSKTCSYTIMRANGQSTCQKTCMDKVEIPAGEGSEAQGEMAVKCLPTVVSDSEFETPSNCVDLFGDAPSGF